MTPRIDKALAEDFETPRRRSVTPDPAAIQMARSKWGFDMGVDVDRLIEVKATVRTKTERVDQVMCVFGAEPAEDNASLIGHAIAIGVFEVEQPSALGHVGCVGAVGKHTRRNQQPIREHGSRVGDAVTCGIA